MSSGFEIGERLPELVQEMLAGYESQPDLKHIDRAVMPSRAETEQMIHALLELMYPGFFGRQDLTRFNVSYHVGELLSRIGRLAHRQIHKCLSYIQEGSGFRVQGSGFENVASPRLPLTEGFGTPEVKGVGGAPGTRPDATANAPGPRPDTTPVVSGKRAGATGGSISGRAREVTLKFLERLPAIRAMLAGDVQAGYDGDPAALNTDEVILAYPGVLAVTVYRLAHELHVLSVPLLPRMMTEWSHATTGIDIHPGAKIGRSLFIDHGTGVVIGETAEIGDNVKIYQGVTLGALSIPRDERGRVIRSSKRHPTVKDNVTIYANAIVLGGETVLEENSVIGGSVFLTSSVPAGSTVTINPPELRVRSRNGRPGQAPAERVWLPDYQI